ncbi:MAG: hypothetical protein QXP38_11995, partial [Nitrososphaerota archaeon]
MSQEGSIPKFKRLPPRTGIPFSGFEFARIDSRVRVQEEIETFLFECRNSPFFNVAFIKAEWGEGKTDAYERYIKPTCERYGDFVYLVSTSTIGDKVSRVNKLFSQESTLAARFLGCVFAAIRDELKSRTGRGDPFISSGEADALSYIQDVLDFHFSLGTQARMFIFLDEFEEIQGMPLDVRISILSGIKELINGQVGMLHEGGRYAGRIHFIIACTPYAYNRIKDSIELAEIFGSFASRLKQIDLPPLKKLEVYRFAMDLLKYSYEGVVPTPLPFSTPGILNTLATISQRNPRAIVQLFWDLMSAASSGEGMKIVDCDLLLDTLKDKELSIYGGVTKCVDSELIMNIIGRLGGLRTRSQQCIALFKLLAGELKPFSHDQIRERLKLDHQETYICVEAINQELQKLGIQQAITRYMPLTEGRCFDDLLKVLSPVEGEVQLLNSRISVERLRDEMIHFEFGSEGELLPFVVFPREAKDVEKVFDMDQADAEWLYERVARNFDNQAKSTHYMLSHELISQLFPSPIWLLIDFITERSKRMELWREVVKSRMQLAGVLEEAFTYLMLATGKFRLEKKQNHYILHYEYSSGKTIQIPAVVYTSTTGISLNDVRALLQAVSSVDALTAFLVYVGDVDPQAQQVLASTPQVLPVHLRSIRVQQLLVERLARMRRIELNQNMLNLRIREILYDLDISKAFDEWLSKARQRGVVIDELKRKYGKSDKELASACKLFVYQTGREASVDDVFTSYDTLDSFRIYGERSDLIPLDLESRDELEQFEENLLINGFLERVATGLVVVRDTPIELRILEMTKGKRLSQEALKRRFINLSANEEILSQVYLPILEHKGKLTFDGATITSVNRVDAEKRVIEECRWFFEQLANKRNLEWWSFAHICVSKERADRVITIEEFEEFVRQQREYLKTVDDESIFLQRAYLIHLLIKHYKERLEPHITAALTEATTHYNAAQTTYKNAEKIIESILDAYNVYSKGRSYRKQELTEYELLSKKLESVDAVWRKTYSKNDLSEALKLLRKESEGERERLPFFFRKGSANAWHFNYKLYSLQENIKDLNNWAQKVERRGNEILDLNKKIEALTSEIKGRLLMSKVSDELKLSSVLFKKAKLIKLRPIEAEAAAKLSLDDLYNFFSLAHRCVHSFSSEVKEVIQNLDTLIRAERELQNLISELIGPFKNFTE